MPNPNQPGSPAGSGANAGNAGNGAAGEPITREQYEAALRAKEAAEANYRNLHSRFGQMAQELGVRRREVQAARTQGGFGFETEDPEIVERPRTSGIIDSRVLDRIDKMEFKGNYGDWRTYWEDMNKLYADPLVQEELAVERPDGTLDVGATYRNLYKEAKLRKYEAAEAARKQAEAQLAAEAEAQRQAGMLTPGGSAVGQGTGGQLDLNDPRVTSDDILASGAIPIDPNDPPHFMTPRKQ